jgi:hypothetical protein
VVRRSLIIFILKHNLLKFTQKSTSRSYIRGITSGIVMALVTTLLGIIGQDLENEVNLFQIKQFYIIIISSQKIFSGRCVTYHGIISTKRIEHLFKFF